MKGLKQKDLDYLGSVDTAKNKEFDEYNTEGYSKRELDRINKEWENKVEELGLESNTDEYDVQVKKFSDELSRR